MGVVKQELTFSKVDCNNSNEIIHYLANKLFQDGDVTADFEQAVKDREKIYPTGLPIGKVSVAIPHTDVKYVKNSSIAIATLERPVEFKNMANNKETIDVSIVVMLAMKEPHSQVDMLQKLMKLFQNQELLEKIYSLNDSSEIFDIVSKQID
ncbi:PTS sugar transporter subunit IIA [Companilactobacillus sp. FL22-1]|uniref:PTS sugar transporter subunit IIA n=1 Tax=Companilactobacillus sp. FL22-1 TaxID=3373892 RepID=UPI0037552B0A